MIRYDISYDMIWHHMIYDTMYMIWYAMIRYIIYHIWYDDMMLCDKTRCDMWHDVMWYIISHIVLYIISYIILYYITSYHISHHILSYRIVYHIISSYNISYYIILYIIYDMIIYLLTAIGLPPSGSSTVHIYTKTIHKTTQLIWEECRPCPVFANYTLPFAVQLRKKHGKTSVIVAEECQLAWWKQNIQNRTYITIWIHKHNNKNT